MIIASFQISGISLFSNDFFRMRCNGFANDSMHLWKSIGGTPSGPGAEFIFVDRTADTTSSTVISMWVKGSSSLNKSFIFMVLLVVGSERLTSTLFFFLLTFNYYIMFKVERDKYN